MVIIIVTVFNGKSHCYTTALLLTSALDELF